MEKSPKTNRPKGKAVSVRKLARKAKRGVASNPQAVIHQGVAQTQV